MEQGWFSKLKVTKLKSSTAHMCSAGRQTPEPTSATSCKGSPSPGDGLKFTAPLAAQAHQAARGVLRTKPKVLLVGDDLGPSGPLCVACAPTPEIKRD